MNSSDLSLGTILDADDTTASGSQPWNVQVALTLPDRTYLRRLLRDLSRASTALDPRVKVERAELDEAVRAMQRAQAVVQLVDELANAHFHADAASQLERRLNEQE